MYIFLWQLKISILPDHIVSSIILIIGSGQEQGQINGSKNRNDSVEQCSRVEILSTIKCIINTDIYKQFSIINKNKFKLIFYNAFPDVVLRNLSFSLF